MAEYNEIYECNARSKYYHCVPPTITFTLQLVCVGLLLNITGFRNCTVFGLSMEPLGHIPIGQELQGEVLL